MPGSVSFATDENYPPQLCNPHSPATFQPRVQIIPARAVVEDGDAKPLRRLHPLQRNRNCKSKTSVSNGI